MTADLDEKTLNVTERLLIYFHIKKKLLHVIWFCVSLITQDFNRDTRFKSNVSWILNRAYFCGLCYLRVSEFPSKEIKDTFPLEISGVLLMCGWIFNEAVDLSDKLHFLIGAGIRGRIGNLILYRCRRNGLVSEGNRRLYKFSRIFCSST